MVPGLSLSRQLTNELLRARLGQSAHDGDDHYAGYEVGQASCEEPQGKITTDL